eukprot:3256841-Pyramimonas_sp.AAC.7
MAQFPCSDPCFAVLMGTNRRIAHHRFNGGVDTGYVRAVVSGRLTGVGALRDRKLPPVLYAARR